MAKDLKKSGHTVFLIGEKHNYADVSRYVDKKQYCNETPSSEKYLTLVKSFVEQNQIDAIIPMGDVLAEFLSRSAIQSGSAIFAKDAVIRQPGSTKSAKHVESSFFIVLLLSV